MRINHNITAINAHRQLTANEGLTGKSLQKLSSGLRINSAGDDAAGLAISEKMRTQIRGLAKAQANAQDSISMIQTAEGSLQEVSDILQRMRELSVQSMNGILSDSEKHAIDVELKQLSQEVDRIAETSKFNNTYLLKGTLGMSINQDPTKTSARLYQADGHTFMTGINSVDIAAAEQDTQYEIAVSTANGKVEMTMKYTLYKRDDKGNILERPGQEYTVQGKFDENRITGNTFSGVILFADEETGKNAGIKINVSYIDLATLNGITIQTSTGGKTKLHIGANSEDAPLKVEIPDVRAQALGIHDLDVSSTEKAQETMEKIDAALTTLNTVRGNLGAYQNRLEYTLNSLAASEENLTAAESRIRDVDMAKEMVAYTQANIIYQSATSMLAQANQRPQTVLQLLQGL